MTDDPFEGIAATPDQVKTVLESRRLRQRDGGVCICGHPAKCHTENIEPGVNAKHDEARRMGVNQCAPSRAFCGCRKYEQVLTAQDLRKFRHGTRGAGWDHALLLGIAASQESGKTVTWAEGLCCSKCKRLRTDPGVVLAPVPYTDDFHEAHHSTAKTFLMCMECREEVARSVR